MVIGVGPPSFLSLSINNHTGKYLWVALIDREKVFRKRKESWKEVGDEGTESPPVIASSYLPGRGHPNSTGKSLFGLF